MSIFKKKSITVNNNDFTTLVHAFDMLALENNLPNPLKTKNSLTVDLNGYSNSFTIAFNRTGYTFSTNYNTSLATYKYGNKDTFIKEIINNYINHFEMEDQIK